MSTLRETIRADLAGLYDPARTFAEPCTTSGGGTIYGVFSRPYQPVELGSVAVSSSVPELRTRVEDQMAPGDTVTINDGSSYEVVEVKPDGHGEVTHRLHLILAALVALMFTSSPPPGGQVGVPYEHTFTAE
jgi:hypothetical protein